LGLGIIAAYMVGVNLTTRAASSGFCTWRELIKRIWEVDPLICPRCGTEMAKIAVLKDPVVITHILRHLNLWEEPPARGPPPAARSMNRATTTHRCGRNLTTKLPPQMSRSSRTTISTTPAPLTIDPPNEDAAHSACCPALSNRRTRAPAPESARNWPLTYRRARRKCARGFFVSSCSRKTARVWRARQRNFLSRSWNRRPPSVSPTEAVHSAARLRRPPATPERNLRAF